MEQLKILNKKETGEIISLVRQQWGGDIKLDYGVMKNSKDKIYLASKDIFSLKLEELKISAVGMYFGEIIKGREIRLSIEGSQLVGPTASSNVVEFNDIEARDWLRGMDIERNIESRSFVIIKHNNDYLGCGKSTGDKIFNYVPKARRITSSD